MPRILHLITGLETGGAERMLARLVLRTDRRRFPTAVVSMTGPGAIGPEIAAAGAPLYDLGLRRGRPDPRGLFRLIRILRATRPDIVQSWLYHADLLGLMGRKLGFVRHLVWNVRCTDMTGNAVVRGTLSRLSGVPDAVIANSATGERFHRGIGYRARRWAVIPNGFDTDLLQPAPEARRRRAAFGIGARVVQLGERRDLDRLYPAFDLVTLSSAYGEGFPNVLGEAMASGVPCVATDVGDAAAIIGDCGGIVPPRDPAALAAAWARIAALAPAARAALGLRARARIVENYALDRIVAQYEALYDEIAGGTPIRPRPA
jgi:glycosyltransferase involved in cell wall biosynthesis